MKQSIKLIAMCALICTLISCKKENVENNLAVDNSGTTGAAAIGGTAAVNNSDGSAAVTGISAPTSQSAAPIGLCAPTVVTLKAGQTIDAGTVSVTNDYTNLYVTYDMAPGWVMSQTHLYVGDCASVTVNSQGNPIPGHFPYSSTNNNETSYTYTIPLSALGGSCGCIAAHAVVSQIGANGNVIQTQTGWGNGQRINPTGGNWGMKFGYCRCSGPVAE